MTGVPTGDCDRVARSQSDPDVIVLTSINEHMLAYTADGGESWKTETLPDDVVEFAIAPAAPWRWTFARRDPTWPSRL